MYHYTEMAMPCASCGAQVKAGNIHVIALIHTLSMGTLLATVNYRKLGQ